MYTHMYIIYIYIFMTIYICRLREGGASVDEDREFYRRQLESKFFYETRKKEWIFFLRLVNLLPIWKQTFFNIDSISFLHAK